MTGIMKSKFLTSAGLLTLLCVLLPPVARADGTGLGDVTITLPTISGSAGDTIVVVGKLTNTSSNTLDFANDSVTPNNTAIGGVADLAFNGFLGVGPSSIGGNSTLTGVDLFTIFIANDARPGLYDVNFYDLLGGTDTNCTVDFSLCGVQLGTIEFAVNVQGAVPTPEPGTLVLLVSGLLASLLLIRRAVQ
ncbi:MAG TPA: PEP-CTERM sorting domain-containing protein [Candidatus Acidoferrum sp.]|nr:PEP-CTERM sorting domain-containing protein [Candidatus Acidoferrum sp.]